MADNSSPPGGDQAQDPGPTPNAQPRGIKDLIVDLVEKKIELLLWLSRMATLVFTLFYLMSTVTGDGSQSFFQKALISNGVTSALRLHQRMPAVRLNAEFLATLVTEDSCHYLLFSLIFVFSQSLAMVLLPPALFAFLHSTLFTLTLLERAGLAESRVSQTLRSLHQNQRVKLFRLIAMSEIMLMPMVLVGVFGGRMSLMTPFMYYRFLKQRYASHRNPYSRNVFYELRLQAHALATHPSCPAIAANAINGLVAFVSARGAS